MDAGSPPVRALDGENVGVCRVLPDVCDRPGAAGLAGGLCAAPERPTRNRPTLGLSHLQFEALLAAAKDSTNRVDLALVAMLGLLGLRIFEACGSNIDDLGEEHGHRVLKVRGKGGKVAPTLRRGCHAFREGLDVVAPESCQAISASVASG